MKIGRKTYVHKNTKNRLNWANQYSKTEQTDQKADIEQWNLNMSHRSKKFYRKNQQNIINLGATVLLESEGQINEFQIVTAADACPSLGKISTECPVGKALLGHKVGDIVTVQSPIETSYKILKIKYKKQKSISLLR